MSYLIEAVAYIAWVGGGVEEQSPSGWESGA